jgi:hypothetical protein
MWRFAGPFNLLANATTWLDHLVASSLIAILLAPVIWAFWRPRALSIVAALLAVGLWLAAGIFFGKVFAI